MMRKYGPRLWLSSLVILWGAVTLGSAWVKSYGDYCAARVLLGAFEAGLFQGCFYTLSCWYLPTELQSRCAWWYSATMLSGAFGGLLAYAVGPLQGHLGLKQWQYLFIIEGAITIFVGLLGLWLCVDFPERWSSRWFKPEEMQYLRLRVQYKDGPVPPDLTFRWSALWEAIKDWKTYFIASLLAFGGSVPTYSVNYTLATVSLELLLIEQTLTQTPDGQVAWVFLDPCTSSYGAALCFRIHLCDRHCLVFGQISVPSKVVADKLRNWHDRADHLVAFSPPFKPRWSILLRALPCRRWFQYASSRCRIMAGNERPQSR